MRAELKIKVARMRVLVEFTLVTLGSVLPFVGPRPWTTMLGQFMLLASGVLLIRRERWATAQYKQAAEATIAEALENGLRTNQSLFDGLKK